MKDVMQWAQKLKNFKSSFGRLRQKTAPKSVPHVQHDYLSSFNPLIRGVVISGAVAIS